LPRERVSRDELRRLFNQARLYHRLLHGELRAVVRDQHPAPAAARQRPGTVSQIVIYFDGVAPIAEVHQYVRPDGSLGASGQPDPIRLVLNGRVYLQARQPR